MANALNTTPKPRRAWPRVLTASTWGSLVLALMKAAKDRLGMWPHDMVAAWVDGPAPGGGINGWTGIPFLDKASNVAAGDPPMLRNADVVTIIMAVMPTTFTNPVHDNFPLWYQFAATAYGWYDVNDKLDLSAKQGERLYPLDLTIDLWRNLLVWAQWQDEEKRAQPRLDMDGQFADATFAAQVRVALNEDGAKAEWKIPLPACKDVNGKPVRPKLDPKTGKLKCPNGVVLIDDPITAVGKAVISPFLTLAAIGAVLWWLDGGKRGMRRTRNERE